MIGLFEGGRWRKSRNHDKDKRLGHRLYEGMVWGLSAVLAGGLENLLSIGRVPSGVRKIGMGVCNGEEVLQTSG